MTTLFLLAAWGNLLLLLIFLAFSLLINILVILTATLILIGSRAPFQTSSFTLKPWSDSILLYGHLKYFSWCLFHVCHYPDKYCTKESKSVIILFYIRLYCIFQGLKPLFHWKIRTIPIVPTFLKNQNLFPIVLINFSPKGIFFNKIEQLFWRKKRLSEGKGW